MAQLYGIDPKLLGSKNMIQKGQHVEETSYFAPIMILTFGKNKHASRCPSK